MQMAREEEKTRCENRDEGEMPRRRDATKKLLPKQLELSSRARMIEFVPAIERDGSEHRDCSNEGGCPRVFPVAEAAMAAAILPEQP